jgi:ABC-type amino acid transport substrate-binding protein
MMDHYPQNILVHADTNKELYETLMHRGIDMLVDDSPIAGGFLKSYKKLKIGMYIPETESQYAIAMKKGDLKLKDQINEVLREMKKNGLYDSLFAKWFKGMHL